MNIITTMNMLVTLENEYQHEKWFSTCI